MDSNLFGISNPFEYAKKLEREYERLSSSSSKSIQDKVDHALNFSFVAWHLVDRPNGVRPNGVRPNGVKST
ncbi:MAG: hypothetical protein KAI84_05570, partial [Gammaproteobacteria bacterium]|nr:hypothetical protein [Gammaproteobacteria bacterium]